MSGPNLNIARSKAMLDRSDQILVRGCQGHKRNHDMLARGYPVFAARAAGARFWDVDGNAYLDYLMSFGPIVLGHADPVVNTAVARQMAEGHIFTVAHEKEITAAELVLSLNPWAGMLGFVIGGSAATSAAVRLARAYTGRDMILRCGYHGWHSWTSWPPGIPEAVSRLSPQFPYGDLQALEDLLRSHDGKVAGVIVETVQEAGPPAGYLQGCIDLTHQFGAICIFDEIKTGFRVALGGAAEHYGLVPDLATFGKACCNGYPASFVVGRKEILATEPCQKAWLAATFHCELLSLAAFEAVVGEMRRRDGIRHQWRLGERLMAGVNRVCEAGGLGYRLVGLAAMPQPKVDPKEKERCNAMLRGCLRRGIYLHPGHVMFLSLAHTERDIDDTIAAVEESIAELGC